MLRIVLLLRRRPLPWNESAQLPPAGRTHLLDGRVGRMPSFVETPPATMQPRNPKPAFRRPAENLAASALENLLGLFDCPPRWPPRKAEQCAAVKHGRWPRPFVSPLRAGAPARDQSLFRGILRKPWVRRLVGSVFCFFCFFFCASRRHLKKNRSSFGPACRRPRCREVAPAARRDVGIF